MFVNEQGEKDFLYISHHSPFGLNVKRVNDKWHIYFKNVTERMPTETAVRIGVYNTEEGANNAVKNFMQAFHERKPTFTFLKEM